MNLKIFIAFFLITFFISACAFVPEVSKTQKYSNECKMFTRKLTLSAKEIKGKLCKGEDDVEACLMTFGIIVPAGSFVISGGVVLAGNTLHWLEYQGTCKDGIVLKSFNKLKRKLKKT